MTREIIEEQAADDAMTARVYESFQAHLEQAARYNDLMDREMLRQRAMVI